MVPMMDHKKKMWFKRVLFSCSTALVTLYISGCIFIFGMTIHMADDSYFQEGSETTSLISIGSIINYTVIDI